MESNSKGYLFHFCSYPHNRTIGGLWSKYFILLRRIVSYQINNSNKGYFERIGKYNGSQNKTVYVMHYQQLSLNNITVYFKNGSS